MPVVQLPSAFSSSPFCLVYSAVSRKASRHSRRNPPNHLPASTYYQASMSQVKRSQKRCQLLSEPPLFRFPQFSLLPSAVFGKGVLEDVPAFSAESAQLFTSVYLLSNISQVKTWDKQYQSSSNLQLFQSPSLCLLPSAVFRKAARKASQHSRQSPLNHLPASTHLLNISDVKTWHKQRRSPSDAPRFFGSAPVSLFAVQSAVFRRAPVLSLFPFPSAILPLPLSLPSAFPLSHLSHPLSLFFSKEFLFLPTPHHTTNNHHGGVWRLRFHDEPLRGQRGSTLAAQNE